MTLIPVLSEVEIEGSEVTNQTSTVAGACHPAARRRGRRIMIMSTKIAGLHSEILPKRLKKKRDKILTHVTMKMNVLVCSLLL